MNGRLLTIREASAQLNISRTVLYKLLMRGDITSLKIGRSRRISPAALEAFVTKQSAREGQLP